MWFHPLLSENTNWTSLIDFQHLEWSKVSYIQKYLSNTVTSFCFLSLCSFCLRYYHAISFRIGTVYTVRNHTSRFYCLISNILTSPILLWLCFNGLCFWFCLKMKKSWLYYSRRDPIRTFVSFSLLIIDFIWIKQIPPPYSIYLQRWINSIRKIYSIDSTTHAQH